MWFSYSEADGFRRHDTEEEAKSQGQDYIDEERDECRWNEEWGPEVDEICWGKVIQKAAEVEQGTYIDYQLKDVGNGGVENAE